MMFKYCLLFALVAVVKSAIVLSPCPAGVGPAKNDIVFESMKISGCNAAPCVFIKGTSVDIHTSIKVVGDFTTTKLPYSLILPKLGNVELPTPPPSDFCALAAGPGGKPCGSPVKMGDVIEYTTKQDIRMITPTAENAQLRVMIKDDAGHPRYCGEITVTIKSKGLVFA